MKELRFCNMDENEFTLSGRILFANLLDSLIAIESCDTELRLIFDIKESLPKNAP